MELRVSSAEKKIFKRAQKLSGDKSLSSFMIRIVKKESEEILARDSQIIATEADRKIFFDTIFGSTKPNQALVDAALKFKSKSA